MFKVLTLALFVGCAFAQQNIRLVSLGGQNIQGLQGLQGIQGLQGLQGLGGGSGQVVLLLQGGQEQQAPPTRVVRLQAAPAPRPIAVAAVSRQPAAPAAEEPEGPPRPYDFEYSATDEQGTTSTRKESSDGRTVQGSYSYVDPDGLTRVVDYTADENGFRATVRTNEPGTAKNEEIGDPADTTWEVQAPPQAVLDRYANVQSVQAQPAPQPRLAVIQAQPAPQPRIAVVRQQPQQQQFVLVPANQLSNLGGNLGGLGGLRLTTGNQGFSAAASQANNPGIILLNGLRRK